MHWCVAAAEDKSCKEVGAHKRASLSFSCGENFFYPIKDFFFDDRFVSPGYSLAAPDQIACICWVGKHMMHDGGFPFLALFRLYLLRV